MSPIHASEVQSASLRQDSPFAVPLDPVVGLSALVMMQTKESVEPSQVDWSAGNQQGLGMCSVATHSRRTAAADGRSSKSSGLRRKKPSAQSMNKSTATHEEAVLSCEAVSADRDDPGGSAIGANGIAAPSGRASGIQSAAPSIRNGRRTSIRNLGGADSSRAGDLCRAREASVVMSGDSGSTTYIPGAITTV